MRAPGVGWKSLRNLSPEPHPANTGHGTRAVSPFAGAQQLPHSCNCFWLQHQTTCTILVYMYRFLHLLP